MAAKTKSKPKSKSRNINYWLVGGAVIGLAAIAFLMLYKLGSIMPGITASEDAFYSLNLGWHGIYHEPLNLPLSLLWSIDFKLLAPVGQTLLRLPAALTGGVTIIAFYILLQLWFGLRTAVIGTILFATSAWTLHVSRLANLNVEYLAAMTFFLLSTAILQKRIEARYIYWLINLAWGLLMFVPGMVFLIAYNIYRQRDEVGYGISIQDGFFSKIAYVLSALIWIPLLAKYFIGSPRNILSWLGLPNHYASVQHMVKEFVGIFYHLFIRGPSMPALWLGRAPLLDIFCTIAALTGIYFYLTHFRATRTHLLFVCFVVGAILVAIGGSVQLSIIMPVVYVFIATGVAYLLSQWLGVFPENPVARSLGYILISLAVVASVAYNVRAYFIAWPNNSTSVSAFDVKRKD